MIGLYIHIPFCRSKCPYCAFNSVVMNDINEDLYLQALLRDFEPFSDQHFDTLYIGGGTPSLMSTSFYERLFASIYPSLKNAQEITIEANPDSFCSEKFTLLKELGINRVSFGVQSFDDEKLKKLGRIHSAKSAYKAVESVQKCGIENISIDLMYGLSGDDEESLKREIEIASKLNISHISAYSLTLEEGTPFENRKDMSIETEGLSSVIKEGLEENGFPQYEVSNFGKMRSLHNLNYWRGGEYVGIGAGSVGFLGNKRYFAKKELHSYLKEPTFKEIEHLSSEDLRFERIFMGLRSIVGVDRGDIKNHQNLSYLLEEKKVYIKGDRIYNNDLFLADEMALYLF